MQQELRGFAHRPDKEKHPNQRECMILPAKDRQGEIKDRPAGRQTERDNLPVLNDRREYVIKAHRPKDEKDTENTQGKPKVANAIDHKSFDRRIIRRFFLIPEPDQQIRREPNPLPAEKQLNKIVRRDQHKHREREK